MKTWLLTWNMERWAWNDPLNGYLELINDIHQVGHAFVKWTCGNNKSIEPGDRIFLIKLGNAPRGIVASGYAATGVFEGSHWDIARKEQGKKARRIFVDFDRILDYTKDEMLPMEALKKISFTYKWSSQSSGIQIPSAIAVKLENDWKNLITKIDMDR